MTVKRGTDNATYFVTPDYLAIGPDDDYILMPLSPSAAQVAADLLGCSLPTTQMVDDIYSNATIKLTPAPIPPSPAMTTVPVFLQHNEMVLAQRRQEPPGGFGRGHQEDVVIAAKVFAAPGKVAIYGWHKPDGNPIQPLYTGHTTTWVDYSHGIRLVQRRMTVNGRIKTIDEVLADPGVAPLFEPRWCDGESRYTGRAGNARVRAAAIVPAPGEAIDVLRIDPGVRIVINRPVVVSSKSMLLVFYALPTATRSSRRSAGRSSPATIGTSTSSTSVPRRGSCGKRRGSYGRRGIPGERAEELAGVAAKIWRCEHGPGPRGRLGAIPGDSLLGLRSRVIGGGSLIFGYIDSVSHIPDQVQRIAFLDANYAYETGRHRDKLAAWLGAPDRHYLVVLAYDDAAGI